MNKEGLSIIIPTYKTPNYLYECLQSIIKQKVNFEYEILVRDDYSQDHSQINIERVSYYHEKVKYYTPTENWGFSKNISFLISEAKGEYIVYLDTDDYWLINHLENIEKQLNECDDLMKKKS